MTLQETDEKFMRLALEEAREAYKRGEVPVGAVVVCGGRVIGRGHNQTETLTDVTAHAEMLALTAAANHTGGKYLPDSTLYVTVEPCTMCAGALGWAHIGRIVYGTPDTKRGYLTHSQPRNSALHPRTIVDAGVLEEECRELMTDFFKKMRVKRF